VRKALARLLLRMCGWSVVDHIPPDLDKFVMIAAPHTSGMDFFLGIVARAAIGRNVGFLAKKSLFRPPLGWIMRWLGGYPVDRTSNKQVVSQVVDRYRERKAFAIALAPEGTRKKVDRLKTGFYHIARGSNVPIIFARLNYGDKEVEFSEPFYTTDDIDADMRTVWDHYTGIRGYHPERGIS
jgi:1-acyl-sn-glycerol-3-phosphate acyltransferase